MMIRQKEDMILTYGHFKFGLFKHEPYLFKEKDYFAIFEPILSKDFTASKHEDHDAPKQGCICGISGFKDFNIPPYLVSIASRLGLYGNIVQHHLFYRSEKAQIISIDQRITCTLCSRVSWLLKENIIMFAKSHYSETDLLFVTDVFCEHCWSLAKPMFDELGMTDKNTIPYALYSGYSPGTIYAVMLNPEEVKDLVRGIIKRYA